MKNIFQKLFFTFAAKEWKTKYKKKYFFFSKNFIIFAAKLK